MATTRLKKKSLVALACTAALATGCANTSKNSQLAPGLGTALDASTTYYGLAHAGATEANPLLSWGNPVTTALGSIALKQGVKYAAVNYLHADPFTVDSQVETAGVAVGVWNIGAIAGAHPALALPIAAVSAYGYYKHRHSAEARRRAQQLRYVFPILREPPQQAQSGETPPRG